MNSEELSKPMDRAWTMAMMSRFVTLAVIAVMAALGTWLITEHSWILATFIDTLALLWAIEVFTTKMQSINKMKS